MRLSVVDISLSSLAVCVGHSYSWAELCEGCRCTWERVGDWGRCGGGEVMASSSGSAG